MFSQIVLSVSYTDLYSKNSLAEPARKRLKTSAETVFAVRFERVMLSRKMPSAVTEKKVLRSERYEFLRIKCGRSGHTKTSNAQIIPLKLLF